MLLVYQIENTKKENKIEKRSIRLLNQRYLNDFIEEFDNLIKAVIILWQIMFSPRQYQSLQAIMILKNI